MYLAEGADSEDGEVGVGLGVAHDIEVDKFFELHGVSDDVLEDIHEQGGDILALCHVEDDAPDGLLLLVDVAAEFLLKLSYLSGFPLVCATHVKFDNLDFITSPESNNQKITFSRSKIT